MISCLRTPRLSQVDGFVSDTRSVFTGNTTSVSLHCLFAQMSVISRGYNWNIAHSVEGLNDSVERGLTRKLTESIMKQSEALHPE